jgi:RNA polymerase-interacting CarD/CdnL/TRCF family regulator
MSGELIAIITLVLVIVYQGYLIDKMGKDSTEREAKLLDRIMTRDYAQLVQGEVAMIQAEKPLTAEEIYAMQQERGVPV